MCICKISNERLSDFYYVALYVKWIMHKSRRIYARKLMLMKSGSFFLEGTKNEGGVTSVYLLGEAAKNSISLWGNSV